MTDTRAAFEAWFLKTRPSKHRPDFALREDGTYTDDHTQRHWWTWQNAVLADRERCAKVCESKYAPADDGWLTGYAVCAKDCADAIRAETKSPE